MLRKELLQGKPFTEYYPGNSAPSSRDEGAGHTTWTTSELQVKEVILSAQIRVHIRIKGQLIKMLHILERVERQIVEPGRRLHQRFYLGWGVFDAGPGYAVVFL